MRRTSIVMAITLACSTLSAQKTMQCAKYRIEGSKKSAQTVFTFTLAKDQKSVLYQRISGPELEVPSGVSMEVLWKSADGLRAVACWIDKKYGQDQTKWHPVYLFDIDFGKPYFKAVNAGGFADFDEIVSSPWKYEFVRLD